MFWFKVCFFWGVGGGVFWVVLNVFVRLGGVVGGGFSFCSWGRENGSDGMFIGCEIGGYVIVGWVGGIDEDVGWGIVVWGMVYDGVVGVGWVGLFGGVEVFWWVRVVSVLRIDDLLGVVGVVGFVWVGLLFWIVVIVFGGGFLGGVVELFIDVC